MTLKVIAKPDYRVLAMHRFAMETAAILVHNAHSHNSFMCTRLLCCCYAMTSHANALSYYDPTLRHSLLLMFPLQVASLDAKVMLTSVIEAIAPKVSN